jgi:hypothetical protein
MVGKAPAASKRREKLLFVNKKKQKTLLCWTMGAVVDNAHGPPQRPLGPM